MTSIWPIILVLFLVLLASYYSQNYVGILASPLTITVSPFIQSAVGILLDSKNAATVSKLNVACVTIVRKWQKPFWATDNYGTNEKCQLWDLILAAVSVLNMYIVHDLNGLNACTLWIVHKQCSVTERHKRSSNMLTIAHMLS